MPQLHAVPGGSAQAVIGPRRPASTEPAAEATPQWLSIHQIARDLGISVSTAYKWSARGEPWFPHSIRLKNRDIRVRRDWYEAWLVAMEQPS